ncbi:MAG TPA: glycosyltransferase family 2 protein [Phormidium sp.]
MPTINTAITLKDLPAPPPGKTGWPWTEASNPLPELMPNARKWPRISIVTPSYNYGQFIEETIRSVLLQGYPNLEYIIIDGGSTDNTVEIIQKYANYLSYWISEPDQGQTDAINKGYSYCTGEVFAWINADDSYTKSALQMVSKYYLQGYKFIAGSSVTIYSDGSRETLHPTPVNFERYLKFWKYPALPQASVFVAKEIVDNCLPLDKNLYILMDYQFFLRAFSQKPQSVYVDQIWSIFRFHGKNKSLSNYEGSAEELSKILSSESNKLPRIQRQLYELELADYMVLQPLIFSSILPSTKQLFASLTARPTLARWIVFWKLVIKSTLFRTRYSTIKR